jgi:hypothetical protein
MFAQAMMQNLGALKVGWYWLSIILVRRIGGIRKLKREQ